MKTLFRAASALLLLLAACGKSSGSPALLVFTGQPADVVAGSELTGIGVAVTDAQGNRLNSVVDVQLELVSSNGAELIGTSTAKTSNGVAPFAGLVIRRAGSGYTLRAKALFGNASSKAFSVRPAAAASVKFAKDPGDRVAGEAFEVRVRVADQFDNGVDTPTSVTLALSGAALKGTLTAATGAAGEATFAGLSVEKAGAGYQITASTGALPAASGAAFTVVPAAAAKLGFATAPAGLVAGETFSASVAITDAFGNRTVAAGNVSLALPSGTLIGTASASAADGVATFSGLRIEKAGSYQLSASSGALPAASSAAFTVAAAAPARLQLLSLPVDVVAGSPFSATVAIVDPFANVAASTANVTLALTSGTLLGTSTVAAVDGVATFSDLSIEQAGTSYELTATSGSLTAAKSPGFRVSPGTPVKLAFTAQPGDHTAGESFSTAVALLDKHNNRTNSTASVTLSLGGATLFGTTTVQASAGLASFGGLSVQLAGSGYQLTATSGTLTPATSAAFTIAPAPATRLSYVVSPTDVVAGGPWGVTVAVLDDFGNRTASTATVNLALSGATLFGTASVAAQAGLATFSGLSVRKAGSGYTLTASSGSLTPATSGAFTVSPDAAAKLSFVGQPGNATAGDTLSTVSVAVLDQWDNQTASTASVALSLGSVTIFGAPQKSAAAGLATFADLSIRKAGTGYSLQAASANLTAAQSSTFRIDPGPATALSFTQQPADMAAGGALRPKVTIVDTYANAVDSTASVALALTGGPSGGALIGTATVDAVAGVASYDLTITKAGSGYGLTATSGGLTGTSATFAVSPGAEAKLVFTSNPGNRAAGETFAVTVAVEDAYANATASTAPVTVSLAGVTVFGTTTVNAVAGVATLGGLSIRKAGTGYQLSATSGTLTGATGAAFDVIGGPATSLGFTAQPGDHVAGDTFLTAVSVVDDYGNPAGGDASVTLALSGATLLGTKTATTSGGTATFTGLSIEQAGAGYQLTATTSSLAPATSAAFTIAPAAPNKLAFVAGPTDTVAGVAWSPAVAVAILDTYGNRTASTASIALTLDGTTPGATFSGTSSKGATAGLATFGDLNVRKAGTGYSILATSSSVTSATSATFAVVADQPSALAFVAQPATTVAGATFAPVTVSIDDQWGNRTASTETVTLALAGVTIFGTPARAAVGGLATFDDLSIRVAGKVVKLTASANTLTSADSAAFDVKAGDPASLSFSQQPADFTAGGALQPKVTVLDQYANVADEAVVSVSVALTGGPSGAALIGTTTVAASLGVSAFDLSMTKAGTGYGLTATAGPLPAANSNPFSVAAAPASALAFVSQPGDHAAGQTFGVSVALDDQYGNRSTSAANVTLALSGATLFGTTTVAASAGVATFSGLSVQKAGTGYQLAASSASVTGATSAAFAISAASASQLSFSTQPGNQTAGGTFTAGVSVLDAYGNLTGSTASITLALANATLLGTATRSAVAGVASFTGLSIQKAGTGYQLTASATNLTGATSAAFDVSPAAASALAFTASPSDAAAGATLATTTVEIRDAFGNRTSSTATIALAISGGATLFGTASRAASAGQASFADLSVRKAGTGYTLAATSGTLASATSASFAISPAAPAALTFVQQPGTVAALATQTVTVGIDDQYGNRTASTASVALGIFSGPGGAVLSGGAATAAVAGLATFSVSVDRAGTYQLSATSGSLPAAASASFSVTGASAAGIAFFVQPSDVREGAVIAPSVAVEFLDANGNRTTSTATVTLSLSPVSGSGTLGGTVSKAAVAGLATFDNLTVSAHGRYQLTASGSGFTATSIAFKVLRATLVYTDPAGGKLAVVKNAASTATTVVLDLVARQALTGYAVGMNIPLDTTRVQANATLMTPGSVINPGTAPVAAKAAIPTSGPLAGLLVSGQSQKAAGAGAVANDAPVANGALLYTLRLDVNPAASAGVVFDGAAVVANPKFRALLRTKAGNDTAAGADFALGRLEVAVVE